MTRKQDAATAAVKVTILRQADIARCRFSIMVPEHYWPSGECKCSDAAHRRMMIRRWGYKESDFAGIPLRKDPPRE